MAMGIGGGDRKPNRVCHNFPQVASHRVHFLARCCTVVDYSGLAGPCAAVVFPGGIGSNSLQPGAHSPLFDRPDALADQVYGAWRGRIICITHLPDQPVAALF